MRVQWTQDFPSMARRKCRNTCGFQFAWEDRCFIAFNWEVNIVACNVNMQCIIQGEIFYRARWPLKSFVELPYKCKRHLAFALTMIQETLEYAMSISRCVAYFEQILCPLYSHAFKERTISQCGLLIMSEATTFPEHGMGWLGTACVPYFNVTVRWVP